MNMKPLFDELYDRSRLLVLDFREIPAGTPPDENIGQYFEEMARQGLNPRLPENRQAFNDRLLDKTGMRYLISRYGEDRSAMLAGSSIAEEGRTIHLGIDIFSKTCETLYAPCNGMIVRVGREPEAHSFGYYAILQPTTLPDVYVFLGHLSSQLPAEGQQVKAGEQIVQLGDYTNGENGGWSRHLHLQMLKELPPAGTAPIGYSTAADFKKYQREFPDPSEYFPEFVAITNQ